MNPTAFHRSSTTKRGMIAIVAGLLSLSCTTQPMMLSADAAADAVPSVADAQVDPTTEPMGSDLFARIVGLWSGPATDTRLGNFPLTNMDFRAVDDGVLFARVDLDERNSLRFAFELEQRNGTQKLIFRNGGLFQGLARDTRMELLSLVNGSYRFCALDGGCPYAEATFSFSSTTRFELRVLVRQQLHETWNAERVETRSLPAGFPLARNLNPAADFPAMGSASVRVTWSTPLAAPADVWAILSTTSCLPAGGCSFSRWIKAVAPLGATSTTIRIDQLHAGSYRLLGVVDRNNSLAVTRFPDSGDAVSFPDSALEIATSVEAAPTASANYTLP